MVYKLALLSKIKMSVNILDELLFRKFNKYFYIEMILLLSVYILLNVDCFISYFLFSKYIVRERERGGRKRERIKERMREKKSHRKKKNISFDCIPLR